jgi:hypothetical protein
MTQHITLETPTERAEALVAGVLSAALSLKQYLDRHPLVDFTDIEADIDDAAELLTDCSLIASFHRRMAEIEPQVMQLLTDKAARMAMVSNHADRLALRDQIEPIMYAAYLQWAWDARFPDLHLTRAQWFGAQAGAVAEEQFFEWWMP